MSLSHMGHIPKRKICQYCNKTIAINMYARYHGEKCKIKLKNE